MSRLGPAERAIRGTVARHVPRVARPILLAPGVLAEAVAELAGWQARRPAARPARGAAIPMHLRPEVTRACPACEQVDTLPAAEVAFGCRHCGTWPDGRRGRATIHTHPAPEAR